MPRYTPIEMISDLRNKADIYQQYLPKLNILMDHYQKDLVIGNENYAVHMYKFEGYLNKMLEDIQEYEHKQVSERAAREPFLKIKMFV